MQVRRLSAVVLSLGALLVTALASAHAAAPVSVEPRDASGEPDSQAMARRVDHLVEQMWNAADVEPAAPADDSEFLRRAYLDLVGVIPRVSEVREFLADKRPSKRPRLVDRLLASPRRATHMATIVRNRILPLGVDPTHDREALGLQKWLRTQCCSALS